MDGVLADFNGAANAMLREYDVTPFGNTSNSDDERWVILRKNESFWHNIPMLPEGKKLWNYVRQYKPSILSALPRDIEWAKLGKDYWIAHNLGRANIDKIYLVDDRKKKAKYAYDNISRHPNILIDDYKKNCDDWTQAKGISIQFKTADEAIARLKANGF